MNDATELPATSWVNWYSWIMRKSSRMKFNETALAENAAVWKEVKRLIKDGVPFDLAVKEAVDKILGESNGNDD